MCYNIDRGSEISTHYIFKEDIPMKEYLEKGIKVINSFITIMKTIFKIFKVDEPDFDLTGENLDTIEKELGNIADQF